MARFVVDTGDLDMDRNSELELQSDIQKLVLGHVARTGFEKPWITKFPHEWYGIILNPELDPLLGREKELGGLLARIG
ncbi:MULTISPECIES: hypothetical protein [Roseobacteraceae]|jgi:hypothetical protein|uniref:Uncharacterized protein n=1 Tax=Falsiruegeria mediterranea M17 TaxID=1200281 RepID=A0A2R8C757_9RHOB|nr:MULTISPECIES: hypothetical protein [Roseobacteraceae]MBO9448980.1 hypothetical protein [Tropicibacter sp. R16_0]SPJ28277.1 hypothetical protein TRM7615_01775 [Falsiruegeria mediterranea M17]